MSALRLAVLAIAAALAGAAAIAGHSAAAPREELHGRVSFQTIDEFLAESKRYLGL